jgi:DNA-binding transcriptional LysR family regulator
MNSFNWDDLRYFLETWRCGSMSGAGRRLQVSHTTVSRHIDRLERSLGDFLFEPTEEGLALTKFGERILAMAQNMDQLAVAIHDRCAGSGAGVLGSVRIGVPDGLGNAFLSRVLPELQRQQPELEIELVPVPITHKLWKREVDIAIRIGRPDSGRSVIRKLMDYDLRIYGSKALLADRGMPKALDELVQFNFIGYVDELLYTPELDFNKTIHPQLQTTYKGATVKAQLDAVRAGIGLGVLPCFMVKDPELVPVMPDELTFERTYWLLIPEELRTLERIRVVTEFIVEALRESRDIFRFRAEGHVGAANT